MLFEVLKMYWNKSDMFFLLKNFVQISDSFQNIKRVSIFEITFDRNKIEACNLHYLKEEISLIFCIFSANVFQSLKPNFFEKSTVPESRIDFLPKNTKKPTFQKIWL